MNINIFLILFRACDKSAYTRERGGGRGCCYGRGGSASDCVETRDCQVKDRSCHLDTSYAVILSQ